MTKKAENPFDLSDVLKKLDPAALTKRYKKSLGKFNLPNLDMAGLIEARRKDVQALTAASRAMLEGTQALMKRQGEMARNAQSETTKVMTDRLNENLAELRANIAKLEPEGENRPDGFATLVITSVATFIQQSCMAI